MFEVEAEVVGGEQANVVTAVAETYLRYGHARFPKGYELVFEGCKLLTFVVSGVDRFEVDRFVCGKECVVSVYVAGCLCDKSQKLDVIVIRQTICGSRACEVVECVVAFVVKVGLRDFRTFERILFVAV